MADLRKRINQMSKEKKCGCENCACFAKKYPFEYLEIFGLYQNLAEYIYPRLEAFRDNSYSNPSDMTMRKWKSNLNKMIYAFKTMSKDDIITEKKKWKKIEEGLKLFSEYFHDLWI